MFSFKGRVADAYVSYKWRRNMENLFGFVRFYHTQKATKAIKNLNGIEIRGCKLSIQLAACDRSQCKEAKS